MFSIGSGCVFEKKRAKGECVMKRETTPVRVTDKIMELCGGIVLDAKPEYVSVKAQVWSRLRECFSNVECMVQEQGGQQVNGWADLAMGEYPCRGRGAFGVAKSRRGADGYYPS